MPKFFTIVAKTINGAIQEFPKRIQMVCGQAQPEGMAIVRDYDDNFCIVNKRVFLIRYGGDLFGTTEFTTKAGFIQYMNNICCSDCAPKNCTVKYNDCTVLFNGCRVVVDCADC